MGRHTRRRSPDEVRWLMGFTAGAVAGSTSTAGLRIRWFMAATICYNLIEAVVAHSGRRGTPC